MVMLGAAHYFPVIIGFEMRDQRLCRHGCFIKGEESAVYRMSMQMGSVSFTARFTTK